MKFAQYLDRNAVEEWRKAYINYRGLKKLVKKVAAHHRERLELLYALNHSDPDSGRPTSSASHSHGGTATTTKKQQEPLAALRDRVLSTQVEDGSAAADLAAVPPPPHEVSPISLDGTGIKLSRAVSARLTSGGGKVFSDQGQQVIGSEATRSGVGDSSRQPTRPLSPRQEHGDLESQAEAPGSASPDRNRKTAIKWQASDKHQQETRSPQTQPPASDAASNSTKFDRNAATNSASSASIRSGSESIKQKPKKKKKQKNKRSANPASHGDCDEYIKSIFDPSERIFFLALDSELERITDFYEERLGEAQDRFELLVAQLRELAAHRRLYRESRQPSGAAERFGFGWAKQMPLTPRELPKALRLNEEDPRRDSKDHARRNNDESEESANDDFHREASDAESDEDEGAKRRSRALEKMQVLADTQDHPPRAGSSSREASDGNPGAAHHHSHGTPGGLAYDPVRYKAARHKLKEAIAEFYRGLELLRTYKVLNKDGFGKILKKFDKTLETQTSYQYFQAKVQESALVKSERVEALLRSTEDAFTGFFEHGDRKKALDRLRMQTGQMKSMASHHTSTTGVGFCLGISLCAIVGGLTEAMKPEKQAQIPAYQALLRVYGALFLPVLFALLFGLNLAAFAHSRINALFIFEWDPRNALDHHQYFEMPAFLMLLLSVAFWVSFVNPFPAAIAPTTWPLIWLVAALLFLLCPFPIFHPTSRSWFIKSILRVFGFGFLCKGSVEFRDFFLGDELNSIAWSLSTLWFFGCEYQRDWHEPSCDPNGTYWTAVLSSLPALLRLGQCVRRFIDSKFYARIHLLNAAKYSTSVLFYFFYIHWRIHGSHKDGDLALWIYFACMMSSFTMSWDILMDWSLFHPNARWPLLRNDLVFEHVWPVYYWAIVTNVILRCTWIVYLLPGPASTTLRSFIVALLEVFRRWQWNFFRVGNEHQGNVDQYRALRDTPLPYYIPKASSSEEDVAADGEEAKASGRANFANRLRLRSWKTKWDVSHDHPAVTVDGAGYKTQLETNQSYQPEGTSSSQAQSIPGGRRPTETDQGPLSTSEPHPGAIPDRPSMVRRSNTVLGRMQLFLVPDRGGLSSHGPRLDEQSAAKGAMGRDYAPRAREADGLEEDDEEDEDDEVEDSDDDDDDDDDDDGHNHDENQEATHQKVTKSSKGIRGGTDGADKHKHSPQSPHHRRKSQAQAAPGELSSSPRHYGYGGASTSTPIAVGRTAAGRPVTAATMSTAGGASNAATGYLTSSTDDEAEGVVGGAGRRRPSVFDDEDPRGPSSRRPYRTDAELRDEAAARSLSKSWSRSER